MEQNEKVLKEQNFKPSWFSSINNYGQALMNVHRLKEYCSYELLLRKLIEDNWEIIGRKTKGTD